MVCGLAEEAGSDGSGLVHAALHSQPTRRVGQEEQTNHDDDGEEGLEGDGEPPANAALEEVEAVVDPVGNHDTARDQSAREGDEETALVRTSTFGLPSRNSGSDHAVTDTTDNTTDDHKGVRGGAGGGGLEDGANDHDEGAPEGRGLTTPGLAVEEDSNGTQEASNLIDGDGGSLGVGVTSALVRVRRPAAVRVVNPAQVVGLFAGGHERKLLLEGVEGEQRRHDTLIVTEHEETAGRDETDGVVEGFAFKVLAADLPLGKIAQLGEEAQDTGRRGLRLGDGRAAARLLIDGGLNLTRGGVVGGRGSVVTHHGLGVLGFRHVVLRSLGEQGDMWEWDVLVVRAHGETVLYV